MKKIRKIRILDLWLRETVPAIATVWLNGFGNRTSPSDNSIQTIVVRIVPDWFYGLSDHLMFLFCSAAGFVCVVC